MSLLNALAQRLAQALREQPAPSHDLEPREEPPPESEPSPAELRELEAAAQQRAIGP